MSKKENCKLLAKIPIPSPKRYKKPKKKGILFIYKYLYIVRQIQSHINSIQLQIEIYSCRTLAEKRISSKTHSYTHWPTESQVTPVRSVCSSALVANEMAWAWTFALALSDQLSRMMSECCERGKTQHMELQGSLKTLLKLTQLTAQKVCGT